MLSDFKNSLNSVLNERVTKPLYGAFIISWLIWNWEIIYLTLFIDQDKLPINKLDYIKNNYFLEHKLFWWPIISTVIILTVLPFISNAASWLTFKFNRWIINKKNEVEDKRLLSYEEGLALRTESRQMRVSFAEMINEKDTKISDLQNELQVSILAITKEKDEVILQLEQELELCRNQFTSTSKKINDSIIETDEYFNKMLTDSENRNILKLIFKAAIEGMPINFDLRSTDLMDYLITGGYIELENEFSSKYSISEKGNKLYHAFLKQNI